MLPLGGDTTGQSTAEKITGAIGDSSIGQALASVAQALQSGAESLGKVGKFADWALRLSIPSVATRVISGALGITLLIIGIIFLGREATQ